MTEIPNRPISSPSAWTGPQLATDSSWIHPLDRTEIDELERAARAVQASGAPPQAFERDQFALPTLGPRLARIVDALENGIGCALIRGLDMTRYDLATAKTIYWGIAVHLGIPISQNARGERIAHVTDTGRDYQSKNVRGYTTRARLRPHCDACDVVGLLCWRTAMAGGESLIASSTTIFNEILRTHPEYLPALFRGFHYDLRGEGTTDDPDEVTFHRVPVFSWFDGRLSCRFNQKSIEEGMVKARMPLTPHEQAAVDYVGELTLSDPLCHHLTFEQGDIQLLNNHTVLHSRTSFEDWAEPDRKRNLLRLWVNLREGRPLAPEFAERLNTGPRGGVRVQIE
ncbi:MAG: TauD/TfdA family dioxygenase [Burkholderiales bacterium]